MTPYDPDRLRAEFHDVSAPDLGDDLADRAVAEAGRRRSRTVGVAGGVLTLTVAAAVVAALTWWPARPTPVTEGVPSPMPSLSSTPSATPTSTPSAPPSTSTSTASGDAVAPDRLVRPDGIGDLRVGMTLADAMAAGLATDQGEMCGPYESTPAAEERYPALWMDWSEEGLLTVAVDGEDPAPGADPTQYVTEAGARVGDSLGDLEQRYPDLREVVGEDAWEWAYEFGLPGARPGRTWWVHRENERALVFGVQDDRVQYLLVTVVNTDGRLRPVRSC